MDLELIQKEENPYLYANFFKVKNNYRRARDTKEKGVYCFKAEKNVALSRLKIVAYLHLPHADEDFIYVFPLLIFFFFHFFLQIYDCERSVIIEFVLV